MYYFLVYVTNNQGLLFSLPLISFVPVTVR